MKTKLLFLLMFIMITIFLISDDDFLSFTIKNSISPVSIYDSITGEYLGCLNCSKYDINSIFNPFGPYGDKYSLKSIKNKFGEYGSEYSIKSVWNPYAVNPPVIKDTFGNKIGYLSVNPYLFLPSLNPKKIRQNRIMNDLIFDFHSDINIFDDDINIIDIDDDPFDD